MKKLINYSIFSWFLLTGFAPIPFSNLNNESTFYKKVVEENPTVDDYFGSRVKLSGDGNFMLVSLNKDLAPVYLYKKVNNVWSRELTIASEGDYLHGVYCLGINFDGTKMVIGSQDKIKFYTRTGKDLYTKTLQIVGTTGTGIGQSCDMSNGSIVIFGEPGYDSTYTDQGRFLIYTWEGTTPVQYRNLTDTASYASQRFGKKVAISPGGSEYVINSGSNAGNHKLHFYYDTSGTITSEGTLTNPTASTSWPTSFEIDDIGTRVVVGFLTTNQAWYLIYDYNQTTNKWIIRTTITETDNFGENVAITADGSFLAIGQKRYSEGLFESGRVKIYDTTTDTAVFHKNIYSPYPQQSGQFSKGLHLNSYGLAIGAWAENYNGIKSGRVYFIDYEDIYKKGY